MRWGYVGLLASVVGAMLLCAAPAVSKDRAIDRDWRTGVEVSPGAMTWTSDNFDNKKQLIRDVAAAQNKVCTDNYAFLGWGIGHGGPAVIRPNTRASYEKSGYSVDERKGSLPTDTVWVVRNDAREAVILWGDVNGSTIYLSCITSGSPASDPDKDIYMAVLAVLGLGCLFTGWWLFGRVRALGKASLAWPSAAGVVKSNEIQKYKAKGGPQFMAKVTYNYDVGGATFAGDRLRFGQYAGALSVAEADAAKYAPGAAVEVRYDPKKPETSVLEPGSGGVSVLGIVLAVTGAILLAIGAMVALIT
jgi:hypothetical protein